MVKILLLVVFILTFSVNFVAVAASDIASELEKCSSLQNDTERLSCYDSLSGSLKQEKSEQKGGEQLTHWRVSRSESKMDGTKTATYSTDSLDNLSNSIGRPEKATLVLRCKDNETDAYVSWPTILGSSSIAVLYKIDDGKVIKETWAPSSGMSAAAFSKKPIDLIKKLTDGKVLIVKITPYGKTAEEAEFNVEGALDAMNEISKACNWPTPKNK